MENSGAFDNVKIVNRSGMHRVVLVCEHASNYMPPEFQSLGLSAELLDNAISWDPGAYNLSLAMSEILDCPLISATVSRLIYDCNRPPEAAGAMIVKSDSHDIPGNINLSEAEKQQRVETYYKPFRHALSELIASRSDAQEKPVLVTIHSFTKVYLGQERDVEIGILHDEDSRLANQMLKHLSDATDHDIRRNEPYGPADDVTHTLIQHGLRNQLLNVMIEVRNDLLRAKSDVERFAKLLSSSVEIAIKECEESVVHNTKFAPEAMGG